MNHLPRFALLALALSSVACAAQVDDAESGADQVEPAAQEVVKADARRALGASGRSGPTWDELLSCVPCAAARYEAVMP